MNDRNGQTVAVESMADKKDEFEALLTAECVA
jgi:hypothetical protein